MFHFGREQMTSLSPVPQGRNLHQQICFVCRNSFQHLQRIAVYPGTVATTATDGVRGLQHWRPGDAKTSKRNKVATE